jgi:NADH-quinone oxidoreductase subunit L
MEQLVLLLPVIPIISALMTQLFSSSMGRRVSRISVIGGTLTFALASTLLLMVLMDYPIAHYSFGETWRSLYFDPLAVLMSTVIAAISLLVRIYSVRYMAEEYGYGPFFSKHSGVIFVSDIQVTRAVKFNR